MVRSDGEPPNTIPIERGTTADGQCLYVPMKVCRRSHQKYDGLAAHQSIYLAFNKEGRRLGRGKVYWMPSTKAVTECRYQAHSETYVRWHFGDLRPMVSNQGTPTAIKHHLSRRQITSPLSKRPRKAKASLLLNFAKDNLLREKS